MSIKETLDGLFKEALRASDTRTKNFIRQLRSKVAEHLIAKGLPRDSAEDDIWLDVTATYRRSIAKALELMERRGAGESELAQDYRFEIEFCDRFLPPPKTAEEIRKLVSAKIEELEAGPGDAGRVAGAVVEDAPKGTVDGRLAKRAAQDLLG